MRHTDMKAIEKDPNFSVITDMIQKGVDNGEFTVPGDLSVLEYRLPGLVHFAWDLHA